MPTLAVATFNIHHGAGRDGVVDLSRTASAIRTTGAEIVALQEVDLNLERSGLTDQAGELAELTGLSAEFWPTLERGPGLFGQAMLTREPVTVDFEPLPQVGDENPHGALVARYRGAVVIGTHLSRYRPSRLRQLEHLGGMIEKLEGPVILMGDLNEKRRHLVSLELAGLFTDGSRHATFGRRHIDHILAGRGGAVTSTRTLATDASDHLPLIADITLP